MQRAFLFLQGVASPFFPRLADRLAARGHRILRVNFCAGDALLWGRRPARHYRAGAAGLADFYANLFSNEAITDLVLFGDERPVHRPAIALARRLGINIHVFEEGYLRPNWFTLEQGGVNANSALPGDPAWYLATHEDLPKDTSTPAPGGLKARTLFDMAYHLANLLNPLVYPGYRTHRPHQAGIEYLGWARRFMPLLWHRYRDSRAIERLLDQQQRYYLLPLQLSADTQITRHSPYRDMPEVLEQTISAFARSAPHDSWLVVKNHPLDTGLYPYAREIRRLAKQLGIAGRIRYLETGHLPTLLDHTCGVITVNSTVGISALLHGAPTIALGEAIYDLPGLTFQGHLEDFWQQAAPPDTVLLQAFLNTVRHYTQINGNLYTPQGIAMALNACVQRLEHAARLPTSKPGRPAAGTTPGSPMAALGAGL